MRITAQRFALPGALLAAALLLTACNGSPDHAGAHTPTVTNNTPGAGASGPHTTADVEFATAMIPHHGQALEMADMALTKATDDRVKQLATQIRAAQDPEITRMSGWLTGWRQPVPAVSGHTMPMEGMMSMQDMDRLGRAAGTAFDRMWVQMMIEHHQGALMMAQKELGAGQDAHARDLATSIHRSQAKEIATMKALLSQLPR